MVRLGRSDSRCDEPNWGPINAITGQIMMIGRNQKYGA